MITEVLDQNIYLTLVALVVQRRRDFSNNCSRISNTDGITES